MSHLRIPSEERVFRSLVFAGACLTAVLILSSCGKANGNVSIQSAPLAGADAARFSSPGAKLADLMSSLMGIQQAWASVSSFTSFKACNDTLKFIDSNGNVVKVNGSESSEVGRGLLDFSPSSTSAMTIGSITLTPGTMIKEVDITFAVVPSVCQGANYAVEFNPGSGARTITQNTAFKFQFSTAKEIVGDE